MNTENNKTLNDKTADQQDDSKTPDNVILKGWKNFINGISEGFNNFQMIIESQTKKNAELWNKNKEKIAVFFEESKRNIDKTLEDWNSEFQRIQVENKKFWEENKDKMKTFFESVQEEWNEKIKKWAKDFNKKQIETKEQWEARKRKINEDIKAWQEKVRKDWESGFKSWRREMIKGSYLFLLFMLPILLVFFIIVWLIMWILPH